MQRITWNYVSFCTFVLGIIFWKYSFLWIILHPNLKSCSWLLIETAFLSSGNDLFVCFFRIRALRRPSCLMWLVRFTLPQTAAQWTCPHTSCAATWSMWSSTSPASTGKMISHHYHRRRCHTGRCCQAFTHLPVRLRLHSSMSKISIIERIE